MTKKPKKKRSFTIPLAVVAPVVAIPFVPSVDGWASPYEDAKAGNYTAVGAHLNNGFNPFVELSADGKTAKFGLHVPRYLAMVVGGVLGHKIASKLGVNKALGQAGVPVIRI